MANLPMPYVNREDELRQLEQIVTGESPSLVLISGESGTGKTSLLSTFTEKVLKTKSIPFGYINLRGSSYTPLDILSFCLSALGQESCKHLVEKLNSFERVPDIVVSNNKLNFGAKISIDAEIGKKSVEERNQWYSIFTGALFEDLDDFPKPFVIVLDTYEQVSDVLQSWLCSQLIPLIKEQNKLLLVICGQSVPVLDSDWIGKFDNIVLKGLEEKYWQEYAQAINAKLPDPEWLKAYHYIFKGRPAAMVTSLATFE